MSLLQPVISRPIKPGTFKVEAHLPGYAHRRYTVRGDVEQHTDRDLLTYCEYTPEFGGRVERFFGGAHVIVHTD